MPLHFFTRTLRPGWLWLRLTLVARDFRQAATSSTAPFLHISRTMAHPALVTDGRPRVAFFYLFFSGFLLLFFFFVVVFFFFVSEARAEEASRFLCLAGRTCTFSVVTAVGSVSVSIFLAAAAALASSVRASSALRGEPPESRIASSWI